MSKVANAFIEQRAKLLAMVQFTSRPDLQVGDFPEDSGLDLLVRTTFGDDFLGIFGVTLKGTNHSLRDPEAATRSLRNLARKSPSGPYLKYQFPVVMLLFSMQDDSGYFAWSAEPVVNSSSEPKLKLHDQPECRFFDRSSLNRIVEQVNDWYSKKVDVFVFE